MADLERMRKKLQELSNPSGRTFVSSLWRPKPQGEKSVIRLIHYPFGNDPFVELWFHYNIGTGPSILCLKRNYGKICPICDFVDALPKTEKDREVAKQLGVKQRVYAVVVDRSESEPVPKYWGFGTQVYAMLLNYAVSTQTQHMLDAERGIDMTVWSEKKSGKMYPETNIVLDRRDSPLAATEREIRAIQSAIKPVEEVFKPLSRAEVEARLSSWLSVQEDDPGMGEEMERPEITKGQSSQEKVTEKRYLENIDEEFERALSE